MNYAAFQSHPEWFSRPAAAISPQTDPSSLQAERTDASLSITSRSPSDLHALTGLHVLGKLEVRRLGMSVLVVEGDDEYKLGLAAGHLSDTAALGAKGNAVIAGHRDTSFWPLRKIRIGDRVRIRAGKSYEYIVSSVRVVDPEDVSVLRGNPDEKTLTMVTCYPFRYFGSAPKRFIVQAVLSST